MILKFEYYKKNERSTIFSSNTTVLQLRDHQKSIPHVEIYLGMDSEGRRAPGNPNIGNTLKKHPKVYKFSKKSKYNIYKSHQINLDSLLTITVAIGRPYSIYSTCLERRATMRQEEEEEEEEEEDPNHQRPPPALVCKESNNPFLPSLW